MFIDIVCLNSNMDPASVVTPQGVMLTYPLCLWSVLIDLLTVKKFNRGDNYHCSEQLFQSIWRDLLVQNGGLITCKRSTGGTCLLCCCLSTSQVSLWVEKLPQEVCVLPNTLAILGAIADSEEGSVHSPQTTGSSPVCSSLRTAEVCSSVKIESITVFQIYSNITYNET